MDPGPTQKRQHDKVRAAKRQGKGGHGSAETETPGNEILSKGVIGHESEVNPENCVRILKARASNPNQTTNQSLLCAVFILLHFCFEG